MFAVMQHEGKTTRRWDMWKIQKQGKFGNSYGRFRKHVRISHYCYLMNTGDLLIFISLFSVMWKCENTQVILWLSCKPWQTRHVCILYTHTYTGAWRNNINNKYINIKALISNETLPLHTAPSVILNGVEGYCTLKTYANIDTNVSSTRYKWASHCSYLQMSVPLNCTLFR